MPHNYVKLNSSDSHLLETCSHSLRCCQNFRLVDVRLMPHECIHLCHLLDRFLEVIDVVLVQSAIVVEGTLPDRDRLNVQHEELYAKRIIGRNKCERAPLR